jgi:hypothetical protein
VARSLLPTLLALAVAVLFGAVPLRECHATGGGGVVLAGEHAHVGACCDGTAADAEVHGCDCGHGHGGPTTPPDRAPSPEGEHPPCCVDASALILVTGVVVALPPPHAAHVLAALVAPVPAVAAVRVVAEADPDPGDGPPDGVVAVVLLR